MLETDMVIKGELCVVHETGEDAAQVVFRSDNVPGFHFPLAMTYSNLIRLIGMEVEVRHGLLRESVLPQVRQPDGEVRGRDG